MSNNGWKEAKHDLTPKQFKEYAELEKRQNLERFREEQIGASSFMIGTVPKGLFDPPDRSLTPDEKSDPKTFFGVTYEMRAERLKAMEQEKPTYADKFKERAKEREPEAERNEQERDR